MATRRVDSPRWKRRVIWILAILLIAPLICLALLNLVLATPWPRGWAAGKISQRTGLEASIGSASWTPWGGACVGDIKIQPPVELAASAREPLFHVHKIRAFPRWTDVLRGKPALSRIEIDRPELSVPLELIASLVSSTTGQAPEVDEASSPPPLVAANESSKPDRHGRRSGQSAAADKVESEGEEGFSDQSANTTLVEVRDGGVKFLLGGGNALAVSGIRGKVPVAGDPAITEFHVGSVVALGRVLTSDVVLPITWQSPELRTGAVDLSIAGVEMKFLAAFGVMRGSPFAFDILIPSQSVDGQPYFKTLQPTAKMLEGRLQCRGALRFPRTWHGGGGFVASDIQMMVSGEQVHFDTSRGRATVQDGELNVPDIRLTGDRISLLGNGEVADGGEVAGVLRIVVPPDFAEALSRQFMVNGVSPAFAPLVTRDREFIDLRWISYDGVQGIELGVGGPVLPIGQAQKFFIPGAIN